MRPLFLPSPALTLQAVGELWDDGTLIQSIGASLAPIMAGWSLGLVIGIPVGILKGYFSIVRRLLSIAMTRWTMSELGSQAEELSQSTTSQLRLR
ncbi:MAG: hypothetical protein JO141_00480 [Bradyrhizobium sp.]|nr:hypothetical protein [Bradyrhizobium sp.]